MQNHFHTWNQQRRSSDMQRQFFYYLRILAVAYSVLLALSVDF